MKAPFLLLLCAAGLAAQTNSAILPMPIPQFMNSIGQPYGGACLYSYAAGTMTPQNTYTDSTLGTPNSNPVVLDAAGRANIWLDAKTYKFVLGFKVKGVCPVSPASAQWTADNISDVGQILKRDLADGTYGSSLLGFKQSGTGAVNRTVQDRLRESVSVKDFGAAGDGVTNDAPAFAAAYTALPPAGGVITVPQGSYILGSAVSFATNNKPVLLECQPGSATTLTYTPVTGTALTFNYGTGLRMGHGMSGCTVTGPGNATAAIGVMFGGTNGAQGFVCDDCKIQSFGTGAKLGSHTWITNFRGGMLRDNGINLNIPTGLTEAGENLNFTGMTFADAPSPHTGSVIVDGGNSVRFTSCSFDQAQLQLNQAAVTVTGGHFENPNFASGVPYPFIKVLNNSGNHLVVIGSRFIQDSPAAPPASYVDLAGGTSTFYSIDTFTSSTAPIGSFAALSNAANLYVFLVNDLSGKLTAFLSGASTGNCLLMPGGGPGVTPWNNVFGACDAGGSSFDVVADIRTRGKLVSIVGTGTPPLLVNSTTPVNNLFGNVLTYTAAGAQNTAATWITYGRVALVGGAATVTFAKAYTSISSYRCTLTNEGATNPASVVLNAGNQIAIVGTGTDTIAYVCVGY